MGIKILKYKILTLTQVKYHKFDVSNYTLRNIFINAYLFLIESSK